MIKTVGRKLVSVLNVQMQVCSNTKLPESIKKMGNYLLLVIQARPSHKQTAIIDINDNFIKVGLRSAPQKGQANAELKSFLADIFQVSSQSIVIKRGQTSKSKLISIANCTKTQSAIYDLLQANKTN